MSLPGLPGFPTGNLLGLLGQPISEWQPAELLIGGEDLYNKPDPMLPLLADSEGCNWGTNIEGAWINANQQLVVQHLAVRRDGCRRINHYEVWVRMIVNDQHISTTHYNYSCNQDGRRTRWRTRYHDSLYEGHYYSARIEVEHWVIAWFLNDQDDWERCDDVKYDNFAAQMGAM